MTLYIHIFFNFYDIIISKCNYLDLSEQSIRILIHDFTSLPKKIITLFSTNFTQSLLYHNYFNPIYVIFASCKPTLSWPLSLSISVSLIYFCVQVSPQCPLLNKTSTLSTPTQEGKRVFNNTLQDLPTNFIFIILYICKTST